MPESDVSRLIDEVAAATRALAEHGSDPSGGSIAALVTALAASLAAAVADRSRSGWDEAAAARAQAQALRRRALALARGDAEAYANARAILANRREQNAPGALDVPIGDAVSSAAEAPMQIGAAAEDVAGLAAMIADRGAPDFRADAAVAAMLAAAAAHAAAHLVEINLVAGADERMLARARRSEQSAAKAARAAAAE